LDSNTTDNKTEIKNQSITNSANSDMGSVNPDSLSQISRFARSGRISPYRIRLSAISERLNQSMIGDGSLSPVHLESLNKVADLLVMKAEFVANGGSFPIREKHSVFDENSERAVEDNFQTLKMLTNLIEKNMHELTASYPRPRPPILIKDELKMPNAKRLLKIVERMIKVQDKTDNMLVVRRKTLDIKSAMREILNRLKQGIQVLFDMLIRPGATRFDVIANLLALLELVKRKQVDIYQQETFGPILIERR